MGLYRPDVDCEDTRLAIFQINQQEAAWTSWLEDIVREQDKRSAIGPELRRHKRYPLSVYAMATPLDDGFRPCGSPFPVLTRDVSAVRIGLVHSRPLDMKFVTLDFTTADGRQMHMTIEVLRCNVFLCGTDAAVRRAVDDMCTYYESGGRFVANPHDLVAVD